MATHMGVDAEAFMTLHHDQMNALQLQFGQYIKYLQRRKQQVVLAATTAVCTEIEITPRGFPLVPDIAFGNANKEELEDLMQDYLTKHYGMFLATSDCQYLTQAQTLHVGEHMFHLAV